MFIFQALLSVFVAAVASQTNADLKTTLTAEPETFVAGVTSNLTLKCSPGETVNHMSSILVFQLSRDGVLLATGKPTGVILSEDLRTSKYSATDQIDINNLNNSFLLFTIQFPEAEDQGQYKCFMNYEDNNGFIASAESTLTLQQNVSNDISVQNQLDQVNQQVRNLMTRINKLETKLFSLDTVNKNQSNQIAQLEARASDHIAFFATLANKVPNQPIAEKDVIVFDQVQFNNGNGYNETSGVFVAPRSGFYALNLVCEVQSQGGARLEIMMQVNDTAISKLYISDGDGPDRFAQRSGSLVYELPQGSRVKVVVGGIQSSAPPVQLVNGNLTYFSGYYLG